MKRMQLVLGAMIAACLLLTLSFCSACSRSPWSRGNPGGEEQVAGGPGVRKMWGVELMNRRGRIETYSGTETAPLTAALKNAQIQWSIPIDVKEIYDR
jgi:hypothetical protein